MSLKTRIKLNVWQRDGYICHYCGTHTGDNPTVDHVIPVARGGGHGYDNLVTACFACNQEKADILPGDFMASKRPNGGRKHKRRKNPADHTIRQATAERKRRAAWERTVAQ